MRPAALLALVVPAAIGLVAALGSGKKKPGAVAATTTPGAKVSFKAGETWQIDFASDHDVTFQQFAGFVASYEAQMPAADVVSFAPLTAKTFRAVLKWRKDGSLTIGDSETLQGVRFWISAAAPVGAGGDVGSPPIVVGPGTSHDDVMKQWQEKVAAAIASGDFAQMTAVANDMIRTGDPELVQNGHDLLTQIAQWQAGGGAPTPIVPGHAAPPPPPAPTPPAPPWTAGPAPMPPVVTPGQSPVMPRPDDAPPPLPPQAPPGAVYTVQAGDSEWKIAQKFTGDGNRWRELIKANPKLPTRKDGAFTNLWAGEHINLPTSWQTEAHLPGPPVTPPVQVPVTGAIYVVQKGDSAWKITERFLGKGQGTRYHELLKANAQKKLTKDGSNFVTLNAGEQLHIPSAWPSSMIQGFGEDEVSEIEAEVAGVQASSQVVRAATLALHLKHRGKGQEDRQLVAEFQDGEGLEKTGKYGVEVAERLAYYGIVPPTPFYWPPEQGAIARYKTMLSDRAERCRVQQQADRCAAWVDAARRVKVSRAG